MQTFGDRSKVAGPEDRHELILNAGLIRGDIRLESDKRFVAAEIERLVIVKIFRRKWDIPKAVFLNLFKQGAPLEIIARMKKAEPVGGIPPPRSFRQET